MKLKNCRHKKHRRDVLRKMDKPILLRMRELHFFIMNHHKRYLNRNSIFSTTKQNENGSENDSLNLFLTLSEEKKKEIAGVFDNV